MEKDIQDQLMDVLMNLRQSNFNSKYSKSMVGEGQILLYLTLENGLTPGILSEITELGTGRIANILKTMEEKGYIIRKKDEKDKRKVYVYVTEKGKQWHNENKTKLDEEIKNVLNYIGQKDSIELIRILKKIVDYNTLENQKEGIKC